MSTVNRGLPHSFCCSRASPSSSTGRNPEEELIRRDIDEALVKPDATSLLLLQTNHDTSHYFANYLRYGTSVPSNTAVTIADQELLKAIEECEEFAKEWQQADRLDELVILLKKPLGIRIPRELPTRPSYIRFFEVLNSRGLAVSWVDRLKSKLMAIVFETDPDNRDRHIDEVHQLWSDTYRCVGLRQGLSNESLRFAATLRQPNRPNRPLSPRDAVDVLHGQSESGPAEVINTTAYLKSVTEAVDVLHRGRKRNAVTRIVQARLLAAGNFTFGKT